MMRETLTPHVVSTDTPDNGLRLVFPRTRVLRQQLEALVRMEQECCGFLSFELTTQHKSITLTIEGPPQAKETLMMFASLAHPPS